VALIERLMAIESPRIPIHQFQALQAEWVRGNITSAQCQDAIILLTGTALDSAAAEVVALVATVPVGTTSAIKADRALKLLDIDQVLLLAEQHIVPYDTPAAVRIRLGLSQI